MDINVFYGILIPFLGTSAGAACVFFMKKNLNEQIQRALTGFAAGVMVAASIWSLLIPAIEQSSGLGKLSFVPAAVGFWIGVFFLLLLDHMIPHLHQNSNKAEGPKSKLQRTTMLVLAVTLHNIPEGMAVGVVYAGYLTGHAQITIMGAMALSIGIAIQNFPEGAIISMPLRSEGMGKTKAFAGGVLSGIVEPVGAVLTILAAGLIVPALPYLLSFAAGDGEAVMVLQGSWVPNEVTEATESDDSWGFFPWPAVKAGTDGTEGVMVGAQGFGVTKDSQMKQEAFDFAYSICTGETDMKMTDAVNSIPADTDNTQWPEVLADAVPYMKEMSKPYMWAAGLEADPDYKEQIQSELLKLTRLEETSDEFIENLSSMK